MTNSSRLICLTLLIAFAGCANEKAEAEKIVRAYNETVSRAYRTGDPGCLENVAMEREARTIKVLIDTKKASGLVLESTLEFFKITSVMRTGPRVMIVETEERWRYRDRLLRSGWPAGPVIVASMRMQYECGQVNGIWKIARVKTLHNQFADAAERGNYFLAKKN